MQVSYHTKQRISKILATYPIRGYHGGTEARFTDRLSAKQPSGSQQGQGRRCNLRWNSFPKANQTLKRKGKKRAEGQKCFSRMSEIASDRHPAGATVPHCVASNRLALAAALSALTVAAHALQVQQNMGGNCFSRVAKISTDLWLEIKFEMYLTLVHQVKPS